MSEDDNAALPETGPTYPVATWWLHDITKLPMCWLFEEDDRENEFVAVVYDGKKCRLYEGNMTSGLRHVTQSDIYGYRQEDMEDDFAEREQQGVEIIVMEDGLHVFTMGIATRDIDSREAYGWHRKEPVMLYVRMRRVPIEDYRMTITPELVMIARR